MESCGHETAANGEGQPLGQPICGREPGVQDSGDEPGHSDSMNQEIRMGRH